MRRRVTAIAAALTLAMASLVVGAGSAGAASSDPYQSIEIATPGGSVTVGQSFTVDAGWVNLTPFPFTEFYLDVYVPSAFRVDTVSPAGSCTPPPSPEALVVRCSFPNGSPPGGTVLVHVGVTALTETYDASFTAGASTEFSSVSDSTTIDVVRPGVTADVHPFALAAPDPLFVGQAATLSGQMANGGTTTMNGVTATVDVGSGLRLDGATFGTPPTACARSGPRATCVIGTLGARSAVPIAVAVTPLAATASSVTTFSVTTTSPQQQPDLAPDTATLTREIQPTISDLGVAVQIESGPIVGASLHGSVVVTNHGPAPVSPVDVVYTVSNHYEVLDRTGCTTAANTVTCRLADSFGQPVTLAPGASRSVFFRLTPTTTAPGSIAATVSSPIPEPVPDPTPDHVTVVIPGAAPASDDLQFVGWNHASPVVTGVATTSDLIFRNNGPSRSRGLRAVITFPSTWTVVSVEPNIFGTCTPSGSSVTCDLDELDGGLLALRITAIPSVAGAGQVATATITTDYPDPDGPLTPSVSWDVVDTPTISFAPPVTVFEGTTASVPLRLSFPSATTVSVTCTIGGWTATAGVDYVVTTKTVTFAPGSTAATFDVPTKPDALDEAGTELVIVACGNAQNGRVADPDPTLGLMWSLFGIADDDPPPKVVPGGITQAEGAATTVKLPVTLSAPSGLVVTAHWQTVDDGALAPGDYTAASGTVTFQPGETSKTVTVTIRNDTVREPDELFEVAFSNPGNATIGGFYGLGFVKIVNDD